MTEIAVPNSITQHDVVIQRSDMSNNHIALYSVVQVAQANLSIIPLDLAEQSFPKAILELERPS